MNQLRKLQLQDRNAPPSRIQECDDMFRVFDRGLSGIKATDTNETLMEVMTSADFTYAIQEFVSRATEPGYTRMVFNYAPLVQQRTLPNYMTVTRYQRQAGVEDLEYVGEKGAPRPGSVVDAAKREYDVQRWEKEFDFSHEALINDDLDYFSDVARRWGKRLAGQRSAMSRASTPMRPQSHAWWRWGRCTQRPDGSPPPGSLPPGWRSVRGWMPATFPSKPT